MKMSTWSRPLLRVVAGSACAITATAMLPAAVQAAEIIITITDLRTVGRADVFTRPDFFAQVSVAGEGFTTPTARNQGNIAPNWVIRKTVPRGTHSVKIALFDKDLTKSEAIDINTVDGKRDLDFRINTRNCRVLDLTGVAQGCRATVTRAGRELKSAEMRFNVEIVK